MWGEAFYQKGWCPIDTETKFEIQGEDENIKLLWIPVGFKLFGYV